jgi:hypothetical protein
METIVCADRGAQRRRASAGARGMNGILMRSMLTLDYHRSISAVEGAGGFRGC